MKIIIRLLTALIPIKKWRKKVRRGLNNYRFDFCFISKYFYKCKLYYFRICPNFGDLLAVDLMKFFEVSFCYQPYKDANFVSVGSHLDSYLNTDFQKKSPLYVWGIGFMFSPQTDNESFNRPVNIYALRGKLSLQRCENILHRKLDDVALGDPGLLIRKLPFRLAKHKKYDVGIVCHMVDKNSDSLKNIKLDHLSYCYIDVQEAVDEFVYHISQCNFILSSSLHGLICADALSIPNHHILLSDLVAGNNYKFKDYYSVFACPYVEPIDLRLVKINDNDINDMQMQYSVKSSEVDLICTNLIKSFPIVFKRETL